MQVHFTDGAWNREDFQQVNSPRHPERDPFLQDADCISNHGTDRPPVNGEYRYISLLCREQLHGCVTMETECSFDHYGAPVLVLTDEVRENEAGVPEYGRHIEIVAYEEGFNIWDIYDGKSHLVGSAQFPVPEKTRLTLRVSADPVRKRLEVTLCGICTPVVVPHLHMDYRAGITACEGINYFYSYESKAVDL